MRASSSRTVRNAIENSEPFAKRADELIEEKFALDAFMSTKERTRLEFQNSTDRCAQVRP